MNKLDKTETNIFASYMQEINRIQDFHARYIEAQPTDIALRGEVSDLILRIAVHIRESHAESQALQKIYNKEEPGPLKEQLGGGLDLLEAQMFFEVGIYFTELSREYPDWKGAPLFTLRRRAISETDYITVAVVTADSLKWLKSRASRKYDPARTQRFFRQLALSELEPDKN
jgi:hypothetical protein